MQLPMSRLSAHTGGEYFSFTLRVVDVVGQESAAATHTVTRLTTPAPVVTISAPTPTLTFGAGELLLLQAKAQLVACNGTEKGQVAFNWSCTDSSSGAVLPLPGTSSSRSALELRGGPPLLAGGTHLLRVVGCLQSSPHMCGSAEVSVTLRDSPLVARLAGGNRAVGVDDGLQLDASASDDPDEPASTLSYNFSCSPVDTESLCPPLRNASPAEPLLTLFPGELPAGIFRFSVSVFKADGEVATAHVTISCVAGSVPTVSVQAPKAAKHNANEALRLLGSAALDQNGTASALSLAWSCSPDIGKLSDPLITSTGSEQANLVLLPGVLPSGCASGACSYTFTLTATHNAAAGPRAAFAQQTILMNVPPSGGNFEVVPSTGYELNGTFALRASYWTDDADDLPLRYSFGISRSSGTDADGAAAVVEPLSGSSSLASRLDVLLPAGSLTLVVTVQDRLGASVTATAGASVLPLPSITVRQ